MNRVNFYKGLPDGRVERLTLRVWQHFGPHTSGRRSPYPTLVEAERAMLAKGYTRTKLKPFALAVKPAALAVNRAVNA